MSRPLMQQGVRQLEEMFAKSKADASLLEQLEHELQHRHVPRAVALLAEVQAAMHGEAAPHPPTFIVQPLAKTTAPISQNSDLRERSAIPPLASPTDSVRTAALVVKPLEAQPVAKSQAPLPTMPLEDVYKILKTSHGATWASIEQTRRTLVYQSHPSRWKGLSAEKRAQVLTEARCVNTAYAVLSKIRCDGR
jgi:hypothetical protein